MNLDKDTAKELVQAVIDGAEAESLASAEAILLFLSKECLLLLKQNNLPEQIVLAIETIANKDEKLTDCSKITSLISVKDNGVVQHLVIAGIGEQSKLTANNLRQAAGEAVRVLVSSKVSECTVVAPSLSGSHGEEYLQALGEGLLLGNYSFNDFKNDKKKNETPNFTIISQIASADHILEKSSVLAESVCYVRDLVNRPGNFLTPAIMVKEAQQIAEKLNLECEVLDVAAMQAKGMQALLAVGQGSVNPPYLITLKYNGAGAEPYTAYVGKGITFDSGGISIKPEANMGEMKDDMAGAGAVLGAISAIARLQLPCNVMGIIACAENMPSGNAQRPGDIVKAANGKTIEVISTDAEGRMVLADAVWYACKAGAAKIIDIATLTGGVIIALGNETAGVIGNNDALVGKVIAAGKKCGESYWQLPILPECKEAIKSDVADLLNSAGRAASSITGGMFIGEFVDENIPWVHLDIGGTATTAKTAGAKVKGGTGFGVLTLVNLAENE